MKEIIKKRVVPAMNKFIASPSLIAVKDGMIATMALTIVGSIFLLLAKFPYEPIADWFLKMDITPVFMQVNKATFDILGLVSVFSIGYYYAKAKKVEALSSGILSLVSYLILIEQSVKIEDYSGLVSNIIPTSYLGSKGMVAAIIIGLSAGKVYSYFNLKGFTIKMPESVPKEVSNSFAAIIPGALIISISALLYGILRAYDTSFIDIIYKVIQTPLQYLTSSFWGAIGMAFITSFLWWFGVHGGSIVSGVLGGVLTANMLTNQAIIDAGQVLNSTKGHIVTYNFRTLLLNITGSGITIGIVLYFLFFAKSEQFKKLGKLSIGSTIFNINEPVLFGTPIVLNPLMLIPFVGVPVVSVAVSYIAMDLGLVPLLGAINPPWTTPVIISGLITGGYRVALLQIVLIAISFFGYFPFIRKLDLINLEQEQASKNKIEN
ncbi:MAG: PTS sugar transporter subunit IIC [Erysipelotrichaceae bacterium]|nr:PTS sugar transporter subunit IIC [Erysipelotrichaceae bacterium]